MKGTGSPTFGPGETATESATGYGIGRGNGSGTRDSKTGSACFVADSRSTLTYTDASGGTASSTNKDAGRTIATRSRSTESTDGS
uniref:Uncharacterized protein n=1 Tax=Picea glauca TaxID=3330 RepID=A0A101LWC1_PICGL|nr:hypothetical protein ABT39_MTgene1674 [Picea glauca]